MKMGIYSINMLLHNCSVCSFYFNTFLLPQKYRKVMFVIHKVLEMAQIFNITKVFIYDILFPSN